MAEPRMITIDNKEYQLDSLSETVKQNLVNLRAIDREIARLKVQMGIAQTARAVVASTIKNSLPTDASTNE